MRKNGVWGVRVESGRGNRDGEGMGEIGSRVEREGKGVGCMEGGVLDI